MDRKGATSSYWSAGDTYMTYSSGKLTEQLVAYAEYAVSVRLKNDTPSVGHAPVFAIAANDNGGNPANGGTMVRIPVKNTDYKTYNDVFIVNNQAGHKITMGLDGMVDRREYTEFGAISMDISNGGSLYIARAVPYDVKMEPVVTNKAFVSSSIDIKTQIVNQVGVKYGENHNFEYTALNADRTAEVEGITVTAIGNGIATISVDETVAEGKYVIFAESTDAEYAGFKKGMEIEVVDSDAFADTTPVMPANLITKPKSYNFAGGNGPVGTTWAPGTSDTWLNLIANDDFDHVSSGWYAMGVGFEKTAYGGQDLAPNTTYVYKATIKAVGEEPPYFNIEYAGNVSKVTTNEYGPEGYAPGYEPEVFAATFNTGANTSGKMWIGLSSGIKGNAVWLDVAHTEKYLAPEAEYEVSNVITGATKIFGGESTTLETKVLNQVGIKGKLDQTVTYVVLNEQRNNFEKGITVIPGENGNATVEVASSVEAGIYNILAISKNGLIKSAQLEVVTAESLADKKAVKPDNFLLEPGNKASFPNNNFTYGTLLSSAYNGKEVIAYREIAGPASTYWGAGPTNVPATYRNASYTKGKNYVVSVRLMNGDPSKKATIKAGFSYATGRGTPVSWYVSNTEDFETYTATFTPNVDGGSILIGFAGDVDRSDISSDNSNAGVLLLDYSNGGSMYVAEEVGYEVVNNFTGESELWPGDATTLETSVLNQVGMKTATVDQNVKYLVLNEDKTAFVDGITVTANGDGTATVEVGEDVAGGNYVIIAKSDKYNIQTSATITVLSKESFVDYVRGAMPANMITNPTGYNLNGGNSNVGVSWSDGVRTPPIYFKSGSTFALTTTDQWVAHGSKLVGYTGSLEANTSYVTSAYVKHLSGSGSPMFVMGYQTDYHKYKFPAEHGSTGFAVTSDYQQYKGTFNTGDIGGGSIWVGLRSADAGDLVVLDNTQGYYLAKEEVYDIVVDSYETELLAGENTMVEAQVLNQIETTGTLEQEFEWYALNADRTGFAEGISVIADGATAFVEAAPDAKPGKYIIYAKSSYGIGKGMVVEVVTNKARVVFTEIFTVDDGKASVYAGVEGLVCDTVKFVIAAYDTSANKLIDAKEIDVDVVDGIARVESSEIAPVISIDGADLVKVFVWDADTLAPIKFKFGVSNTLWE